MQTDTVATVATVFTCQHCEAAPEQITDGKAHLAIVRHQQRVKPQSPRGLQNQSNRGFRGFPDEAAASRLRRRRLHRRAHEQRGPLVDTALREFGVDRERVRAL